MHFVLVQIEMMSESIDETLDKDEAEEETEELTNQACFGSCYLPLVVLVQNLTVFSLLQVLDEIGVDIASQVGISFGFFSYVNIIIALA